jgi:hypothetical protein
MISPAQGIPSDSEPELVVSPKLKCPDIPRVTIEIISQLNTSKPGEFSSVD